MKALLIIFLFSLGAAVLYRVIKWDSVKDYIRIISNLLTIAAKIFGVIIVIILIIGTIKVMNDLSFFG